MKLVILSDTEIPQYLPEDVPRAQPWWLNTPQNLQHGQEGTKKSNFFRKKMKKTTARNQKGN